MLTNASHPADSPEQNHPHPAEGFAGLNLPEPVMKAVHACGFEHPTPIQAAVIPSILAGQDIIGSAQTGTGKTAAFALPILSKLIGHKGQTRVLILEPTRELAAQVEAAIKEFARFTHLRVAALYGGVGYGKQTEALRSGADIIVATPGRLQDHIDRGHCNLKHLQFLVLDEADRMLDMGFLPDVRRIIQLCPTARQTCLFSATIPQQIDSLIKWAMKNPRTVEIGQRRSPAENVRHVVYPVADAQKNDLLFTLLERVGYHSVIVFCRTKHRAERVAKMLKAKNHSVAALHGDRSQREREKALQGFREGKYEVLVATDIAARGLDVPEVSHVINFDVPQHPENYVHRIGRTGRAEATGDAFTLMVAEESKHMAAIERFIGKQIERVMLENYQYTYTALHDAGKPGAAVTGRARGGRIRGGYSFAPSKRR